MLCTCRLSCGVAAATVHTGDGSKDDGEQPSMDFAESQHRVYYCSFYPYLHIRACHGGNSQWPPALLWWHGYKAKRTQHALASIRDTGQLVHGNTHHHGIFH